MTLARLRDEPCFRVTIDGSRVETSGPPRFHRGHTIAVGDGTLDGAFGEWSWNGRRLTIRTDRYGAAPLFYAQDGNTFLVSPSIVKLVEAGAPTDFDEPGLALFLRLGFFVGDDTPFRAIRAMPPNGTVVWDAGRVSVSGGYRTVAAQRVTRGAAIDGFVELFRRALARRPPTQGDAIVPLSAGRDSRHILIELCRTGRKPRHAVTLPHYPPRAAEDERLAPVMARELGVSHVLLPQTESSFVPEVRKNWETHLCADEHAWFIGLVDYLERHAGTVYDGLGGGLSVSNRFYGCDATRLMGEGRCRELAARLLQTLSRSGERFLQHIVQQPMRAALSFDRAVDRLADELARHRDAADPMKSFNFWNRIRRELALTPYALMRRIPMVYSPYLDYELFDFLMSLPPDVTTPTLSPGDKSFHSAAITRGYPAMAHVPFEDSRAPTRDCRRYNACLVGDAGGHLVRHGTSPTRLLNKAYVLPRLVCGIVNRAYREAIGWLPNVALYLFQVDALAERRHAEIDVR